MILGDLGCIGKQRKKGLEEEKGPGNLCIYIYIFIIIGFLDLDLDFWIFLVNSAGGDEGLYVEFLVQFWTFP